MIFFTKWRKFLLNAYTKKNYFLAKSIGWPMIRAHFCTRQGLKIVASVGSGENSTESSLVCFEKRCMENCTCPEQILKLNPSSCCSDSSQSPCSLSKSLRPTLDKDIIYIFRRSITAKAVIVI